MRAEQYQSLCYYQFDLLDGVRHAIFTRQGGVSPAPWDSLNVGGTVGDSVASVRRNHELMCAALGLSPQRTVTTWQVHGNEVVIAQGPVAGRRWLAQADGLITDQPDLGLVMRFADCVPLLFYDAQRRVVGIAHAGWRGTVRGIAANMVRAMGRAYGCRPADIAVGIGPSICGQCFQVGEEVVQAVYDYFGTNHDLVRRDPDDGTAYVDLWAANALDLRRAGVERISISHVCTYQHTDQFYSFRAEKGQTGRFGAIIAL